MTEDIQKYRPSNASVAEGFEAAFCFNCARIDEDPHGGCPIWTLASALQVDDPNYPTELRLDDRGRPTCLAFECSDGESDTPTIDDRCKETLDMFRDL